MAFERPTLTEIRARIQSDLQSRANGGAPYVRRAFENVLAWAIAGVVHGLHGHVDWASRQLLPTTCDAPQLSGWASMLGVTRKPPVKAKGTAIFAGTNGVLMPSGTVVQRRDGARYITTADAIVMAGTVAVQVVAETAGIAGNVEGAAPLSLVSPISGISSSGAFTSAGAEEGVELEALEAWRERVLIRLGATPRGGSSADYVVWTKATPGVLVNDVYVEPGRMGGGTVGVSFTVVGADPIPSVGERDAVALHLEGLRPIDMRGCTVFLPIPQWVNYSIALSPNTPAVSSAVEAAIRDLHRREAKKGAPLLLSHIREAVSTVVGETDHMMLSPNVNVAPASIDHLLVPGSFSFSTLA